MMRGRFWMAFAALLACLALTQPAFATGRFKRAESAHFTVTGDMSEARLRDATESLESFDALLRTLLQPTTPPSAYKLEIYLFPNEQDFRAVWPAAEDSYAGFYTASPELIAAFALYNQGSMGLFATEVLYHEYAHHFMLHHFADAYPAFFVEGFAEFVQTAEVTRDTIRVGAGGMRLSTLEGGWLSIERLLAPDDRSRRDSRFYAQSWLATHYLINNQTRMQSFQRYLTALEEGGDPIASFQPAFGITPAQFQNELRVYMRNMQGFVIPRGDVPDSQISITILPDSADDLLTWDLRMRREPAGAERHEDVERIARIAARYPGDTYAQSVLAGGEIWRLQFARAREILEPLIAANPDDAQAQYLMGLSYIIEAQQNERADFATIAPRSRRYFARVTRIDPNHAPSLFFYATSYMGGSEPMPDNAIDALIQAHLLAPQVVGISLNTAQVLVNLGMNAEAIPILRSVLGSSHGGNYTDYARQLLNQALGIEGAPAEGAESASQDEPSAAPVRTPLRSMMR